MSDKNVCPSCGGYKPALMACQDCGFTLSKPAAFNTTSPTAPSAKPTAKKAPSTPISEYRAVKEAMGNKKQVLIKTKKRRVYQVPGQD